MFWNFNSTDKKKRALAMGGPLASAHAESFERLKSRYGTSEIRQKLAEWWNTTDRASAFGVHDWLIKEGHSLEALSIIEGKLRTSSIRCENPEGRVAVALANHATLKEFGLTAWDKGRLVSVARWCTAAGYITRDEGWEWVLEAATILERTYRSWEELGEGWALGWQYWTDGAPISGWFREHLDWLRQDKESPWKTLRWKYRK